MRVLFDASVTDFDRGGTSRYVRAIMPRLARLEGLDITEVTMQEAWPWSARLPRTPRILLHDLAWVPRGAVMTGVRARAALYHGAGFKVPPRAPFAVSVTIHDDTPWDHPPTARLYNRVYMRRVLQAAAPRLAGAITSAETTARSIVRRLPELRDRVHVTPWGVDPGVFRPRPPAEVAAAMGRAGVVAPYAMLVSPYGRRKNEARMITALGRARSAAPALVALVAGRYNPPSEQDPLPVVRAGRIPDDDLASLYTGAALLMYASLHEGFGLPVLEAMACGCPVVTSRGTVLEEVGGDAVLLVDPRSESEMVVACQRLLAEPAEAEMLALAGRARAAAFTWERTAELTRDAWVQMTV
ncbi:MAG: glycosyltransferase family 4 protein [Candidatus Dormibacteraeota bacterium]|nr:glycosyltransferase family 4 protein [Candidatus Dormibacteraeota bacterium]